MGSAKAAKEIEKLNSGIKGTEHASTKLVTKHSGSGGLLGFLGKSEKSTGLLSRSMGGLKTMLLGGFALGGLMSAAGLLKSFVDTTKTYVGETKALKEATGLSAQSSLYAVAAGKARGVSESNLARALTFTAKNVNATLLGETKLSNSRTKGLKETGKLSKDFAKLGLDPKKWLGEKPDQQINAVMEAFQKFGGGLDSLQK